MLVKCKCCGNKIERESAYKVTTEKGNKYYCNESCFKKVEAAAKEKAEYDAIFEQTKIIFGYQFQGYSMLKREVKNWEKLADRNKILSYLKENESYLSSALGRKEFTSDFYRVRYYSVIVSSKLHDYKVEQREDPEKITVDCEIYETPIHTKKKRRGLSELEDEVI